MNRRAFLLTAAAALVCATSARAQQQPVLIAWLNSSSRELGGARWVAAFKEGLAALGWKEGVHYTIEERWTTGRIERLQPLAEELAARRPAIFVAATSLAVGAAAKAAPTTPVVHANGSNPVNAGFAKSLARPGGMITGVTSASTDVTSKYLELLLGAAPHVKHVGFLVDPRAPNYALVTKSFRDSVAQHSVQASFADAARREDIESAIAKLAADGAQALVLSPSPILGAERERIAKLALARRWPLIANTHLYAEAGALLTYGADNTAQYRRAAYYVDKILKGAKPGDLPFEQPTKYEMVVNGRTARALKLSLPQELLLRADRVIE